MVEHMPPTWPLLSDYPFQQLTVCVCVCVCVCVVKKRCLEIHTLKIYYEI